jgi:hypothetical protein
MPAWSPDSAISFLRSSFDDLAQDVIDSHDADGLLGGVGVLTAEERGERRKSHVSEVTEPSGHQNYSMKPPVLRGTYADVDLVHFVRV